MILSLSLLEINLLSISDGRRFLWTLIFVEVQLIKNFVHNVFILIVIRAVRILSKLLLDYLSILLRRIERHVGVVARTLQ